MTQLASLESGLYKYPSLLVLDITVLHEALFFTAFVSEVKVLHLMYWLKENLGNYIYSPKISMELQFSALCPKGCLVNSLHKVSLSER